MTEAFSIYVKLWGWAEREGAVVSYYGMEEDGGGAFKPVPRADGKVIPLIQLVRRCYPSPAHKPSRERNPGGQGLPRPDILAETITLAHECGHFLSWKERTPPAEWAAYTRAIELRDTAWESVPRDKPDDEFNESLRAAAQNALSEGQMELILAEEARAWVFGGEVLQALGFENFESYEERKRLGLHYHRYRLGIDDLWEGEGRSQATEGRE